MFGGKTEKNKKQKNPEIQTPKSWCVMSVFIDVLEGAEDKGFIFLSQLSKAKLKKNFLI